MEPLEPAREREPGALAVLDSHVHVWDPERFDYPWLGSNPTLARAFLPEQIDSPATGMVFVQADCRPEQALAEARWVASLNWPELVGIVAGVDLRSAHLGEQLDVLGTVRHVVGVRHILQVEATGGLRDAALREGLGELAARGIRFDACVRHEQLPELLELLSQLPELYAVLDHLGKPPVDAGLASAPGLAWAESIRQLAELPRLYVKLSGLSAESRSPVAFAANADAFLDVALQQFGPERSMLGSDWPVSTLTGVGGSFSDWLKRIQRRIGSDARARDAVESTAGAQFYRIVTTG